MRIRALMLVVALMVGLAGCGDDAPADDGGGGGGGATLPDACSLVTRADVEAAVGGVVAEGSATEGPNHYAFGKGSQCTFVPEDAMVSATWVTLFHATDESWSSFVAQETDAFGSEPLAGVGDEAIIDVATIGVRSGGFALTLQFGMYDPHGPGQSERMVAMAKAAVGRLTA